MSLDVEWFAVGREDLVDVLLGEESPRGPGTLSPPGRGSPGGKLALGYTLKAGRRTTASPPSIVVMDDQSATETLSWLRVYAEDVFPISQFARVVRTSDWDVFSQSAKEALPETFRPGRWASVAVGETLAQSDSEVDLRNMPLSRLASSLSLPVGRTAGLFGHGEPTHICVDRLRSICEDARLGRRALGVEQLATIWALCDANIDEHLDPSAAAELVVHARSSHLRDLAPEVRWDGAEYLDRHAGLRSDSVEQRVMAFSELALEITQLPASQIAGIGSALLAAGCFMVGRSTSHVFLLNRFQRVAPSAFAWFGLMAAFAGPRAWDAAWLRAVKGAERLLRPNFAWTDTPTSDIGWIEFSWLAGTFDELEQLVALPKMLPRTLGVEVVPGVVLQIRLGQGASEEVRAAPDTSARERMLSEALIQIIGVAHQAVLHDSQGPSTDRGQRPLDLGLPGPPLPVGKAHAPRRASGTHRGPPGELWSAVLPVGRAAEALRDLRGATDLVGDPHQDGTFLRDHAVPGARRGVLMDVAVRHLLSRRGASMMRLYGRGQRNRAGLRVRMQSFNCIGRSKSVSAVLRLENSQAGEFSRKKCLAPSKSRSRWASPRAPHPFLGVVR